jgi:hypothetical protein
VIWLVLALVLVVVVAAGWLVVARIKRGQTIANRILPGVATHAPKEWVGAHSKEAKLHRRLRDAMTSLRAISAIEDGSLLDLRVNLEQEALAVDDQLIAAAALPARVRDEPLSTVEQAVAAVEDAVGVFASAAAQTNAAALQASVTQVRDRMAIAERIRDSL